MILSTNKNIKKDLYFHTPFPIHRLSDDNEATKTLWIGRDGKRKN